MEINDLLRTIEIDGYFYVPEYWCLCKWEDYLLKEDYDLPGVEPPVIFFIRVDIPVNMNDFDEESSIYFNDLKGHVIPLSLDSKGKYKEWKYEPNNEPAYLDSAYWEDGHEWVNQLAPNTPKVSENTYIEYYGINGELKVYN